MHVYLIRHGQTTANAEHIFAGVLDVDLTPTGIEQAEDARDKLKSIEFDAVYVSTLKRAVRTAEIIFKEHQVPIYPTSAFQEMNFGIWEGKTIETIRQGDGDLFNQWILDYESFKVPEGESVKELFERVTNAYNDIIRQYDVDSKVNVAIVAHGGVIQALLSYICYGNNSGYWRFKVDNCGINKIEFVMKYPVIQAINQ